MLTFVVATIGSVHPELALRHAGLGIPSALRAGGATRLVPGRYLQQVASRASLAQDRRDLAATADRTLAPLQAPDHPLQHLDAETAEQLHAEVKTCAVLFQRSSACEEGRNGPLALLHHGLHRHTETRRAALTVVHSVHTRRPDGITPAERCFEADHRDLFTALLDRTPQRARPAKTRSLGPSRTAERCVS
ncbi:MAG: hypothetical protein JXX28_06685 [Deltaproteobacteria bacterium]|nr:hypothetical protein [Deltaproteobacteria bacterium]